MSDNLLNRGQPDRALLNRHEAWEVNYFLNHFNQTHGSPPSEGVLAKARRVLAHVPGNLRSHDNVAQWMIANWASYN